MTIEDELLLALDQKIKNSENKKRDIDIIHTFYGFLDKAWPTLDEIAIHFNMNNRERIRQIINAKFRKNIKPSELPSVTTFASLLKKKPYWTESELCNLLEELQLSENDTNIRSILILTMDLGINHGYEIYTPDLKPATRNTITKFDENFVIHKDNIKVLQSLYNKAKKNPGRCGIANLYWLQDERIAKEVLEYLKLIIKYSEHSWIHEHNDGFWYIFENRDNTIINYSEKVFSVISNCDSEELAKAYRNALNSRTHSLPYPDWEIIKEYLESSIFFDNNDGQLHFIAETHEPNDTEKDVIKYLSSNGTANLKELRGYLTSRGYGKVNAEKNIMYSPFIHVDKTEGRIHYTYRLVGEQDKTLNTAISDEHYLKYRNRLRKIYLMGTDDTAEHKRRREQHILSESLFSGKIQDKCAICGNTFSIKALVAAHKKKRSECNEAERTDPHIVMPLCVFGCDYLYENRYIYIDNGVIKKGKKIEQTPHETSAIRGLIGRQIPELWLRGSKSYFNNPLT